MIILKSDLTSRLESFLIQNLGLDKNKLVDKNKFFYFNFNELSNIKQINWQTIDTDLKNALTKMGLIYSSNGSVIDQEQQKIEARAAMADRLRKHAIERNRILKERAYTHQKEQKEYDEQQKTREKYKLFLTPGKPTPFCIQNTPPSFAGNVSTKHLIPPLNIYQKHYQDAKILKKRLKEAKLQKQPLGTQVAMQEKQITKPILQKFTAKPEAVAALKFGSREPAVAQSVPENISPRRSA